MLAFVITNKGVILLQFVEMHHHFSINFLAVDETFGTNLDIITHESHFKGGVHWNKKNQLDCILEKYYPTYPFEKIQKYLLRILQVDFQVNENSWNSWEKCRWTNEKVKWNETWINLQHFTIIENERTLLRIIRYTWLLIFCPDNLSLPLGLQWMTYQFPWI